MRIEAIEKNNVKNFKFNKFVIVGVHKVLGQQQGKKIFDTYAGAQLYINRVIKQHKNYKNYTLFFIKGLK